MNSTVKTIVGLVFIGLVVIGTFLYGNAQRQDQLRKAQDTKRQQAQVSTSPAAKKPVASPTVIPSASPQIAATGAQNQPTTTPQTGADSTTTLAVTASALATLAYRRSRRQLQDALALPRG